MRRALAAGLLAAVACAVVGTWVVLRGLTFLGDALAHGVVPGLALAVLWGFSPVVGALVAALVMSGAITLVSRRAGVREDTGIGLLFVGMLALGVVIISRSDSFATDVTSVLFGDVLGVTAGDLRGQAVGAAVVVAVSVVLYRPFLALAFNEDKAATLGMRPGLTHALLMVLLATAIVVSFQAIGTLLVFGLLIGPPATAGLLVRRVPLIMATAVALGAATVVAGLALSYHHDTAGGATIAGLGVAEFFVVLAAQEAPGPCATPAAGTPSERHLVGSAPPRCRRPGVAGGVPVPSVPSASSSSGRSPMMWRSMVAPASCSHGHRDAVVGHQVAGLGVEVEDGGGQRLGLLALQPRSPPRLVDPSTSSRVSSSARPLALRRRRTRPPSAPSPPVVLRVVGHVGAAVVGAVVSVGAVVGRMRSSSALWVWPASTSGTAPPRSTATRWSCTMATSTSGGSSSASCSATSGAKARARSCSVPSPWSLLSGV